MATAIPSSIGSSSSGRALWDDRGTPAAEPVGQTKWFTGHSIRFVIDMIALPFLLRRRLTGASATLLVIWIASFNILWQFPFLGLFGSIGSMMVIAAIVNTAMRPAANVQISAPPTAAAGQRFLVSLGLTSGRRIAAHQVAVGFNHGPRRRHAVLDRIALIESLDRHPRTIQTSLLAEQRGEQKIPDLQLLSTFPFELWRIFSVAKVDASILVTPNPVLNDAPESVTRFGAIATQWIDSKRQQDETDYAGSREYVTGQTVRQWDFRAWARLDRPMVRIPPRAHGGQTTLIIDPAVTLRPGETLWRGETLSRSGVSKSKSRSSDNSAAGQTDATEWLFRVAASIVSMAGSGLELQMFVTGPQERLRRYAEDRIADVEPLSQLALAEAFEADDPEPANQTPDASIDPRSGTRFGTGTSGHHPFPATPQADHETLQRRAAALLPSDQLDHARNTNVLILTTRTDFTVLEQLGLSAKIVRLSLTETAEPARRPRSVSL